MSRQRLKLEGLDWTACGYTDDFISQCLSPDDTANNVFMAYPADLLSFLADFVAFKQVQIVCVGRLLNIPFICWFSTLFIS